jgi:iron complex outermembrane recepter protein
MRCKVIGASVIALFTAGAIDIAAAQQAASPQQTAQSAKESGGIEQITVTATKRAEDIKEVPLSITAVSGSDLKADHITDMTDLTRAIPDISFSGSSGNGAGAGLNNIEIRGVSSQAGPSTVGIYLDDVSLTTLNLSTQGDPEPKFFDLERIEVLRGPQGTIYGASSMGGTIKFVSNQPNLTDLGGSFSSDLGSNAAGGFIWKETGVLNIPIIDDVLALRTGLQIGRQDGYINLVSPSTGDTIKENINGEDDTVFKLALKWKVNADLTITPSMFYQRTREDDDDVQYLTLPEAPLGPPNSTGTNIALPPNEVAKLVQEPGVDRLWVPSLTINDDVGFGDVTSVTSYYWRNFRRIQDGTFADSMGLSNDIVDPVSCSPTPPNGAGCGALNTALSNLGTPVYYNNTVRQISEEFRIASKPYDPSSWLPLTWIAGVYYSDEVTEFTDNEPTNNLNSTLASFGYTPAQVAELVGWDVPGLPPFPNDVTYLSYRHYDTTQYAAFGQGTYYILPTLKATAGLRYLLGEENFNRIGGAYWAGGPSTFSASSKSYAATPKFALDWDITPENTGYINIAKGFRLGSENRPVAVDECIQNGTINGAPSSSCTNNLKSLGLSAVPASYAPDSLWNYEIGDKARMFGNRLSVDAGFFFIDWDHIQQDVPLPQAWDFFTNTGSAQSYGVEWDVKGKPIPELTLGASGSFTHATITTSTFITGVGPGSPVEGVPMWNAKLSAAYTTSISNNIDLFARGDWDFTGHSHGVFLADSPDFERPSYSIVNASIGAYLGDVELSLYAKNLLNEDKIIQQPLVQVTTEGYRPYPRVVGVNVSVDF